MFCHRSQFPSNSIGMLLMLTFFLGKFMKERSEIILCSITNLNEIQIKDTRMISTSNRWFHCCVSIQSSLFSSGLYFSNIVWCIALFACVILVGGVLIILNQFNLISLNSLASTVCKIHILLLCQSLPVNSKIR